MPSRTAPAMSCTRGSSVARPGGSSTARSLCVRMPRKPTPSRPTRRCCSSTTRVLPRAPRETRPRFDVRRVREDFPILRQKIHGKPLIYLDNAASTQKPQVVIDTLHRYYETNNANVHRGVHLLSQRATQEYEKLLTPRTKLVSVTHVSNTLGTINPIKRIIELAHRRQIPVLIDGAQAAPHLAIDVQELDCDFYAFSGHKVYGPTGIGILYGKAALLEAMPPYQGGGDMISSVTFERTTYNCLPHKFEAGTPNIAGVIGLGAALDYVT